MYCVPVGDCVSSVIPWFFDVFLPDICLVCAYMRVEISLFNSGILGSCGVFLFVKFLCAILLRVGCGRSLSVLRILHTAYCLVKYVGECLVCVMYVCRWLYCSEGVFCVLCEFVPVCLPVVSV